MRNPISGSVRAAAEAIETALSRAVSRASAGYRSTGAGLRTAAGHLRVTDTRTALTIGGGAALSGVALYNLLDEEEYEKQPRTGTAEDAVRVNKWWNSLTPQEQKSLLAEDPERIGNLNGIPVEVRNAANQRVMNADIRRVEDVATTKGVPVDAIEKDPKEYGLTADDITRYHNAINVRAGLEQYSGSNKADPGRYPQVPYPTYLYVYQPLAFGGKGRAAISIGDPDTAPNTAVVVPGASQSVRASDASDKGWFDVQGEQAQNLYVESNRADPDHPTAVVAWMGYDSPTDGITAVLSGDPTAERKGGNLLAEDVDGLWATHQGPSHLTVVGYSAGAIVTADAAAASQLHANDVVLLGPVSTDEARSAADFHLDRGHVYVGSASNDLNAYAGHAWLGGPDPAGQEFGATRIKAEAPESYSSPIDYSVQAHLHYFTAGSESLYATGLIASGNADRLGPDNMLAEHKEVYPFWPDDDPEEDRTSIQDNHYHGSQ
ncbi:alpha/beta hydrolase [Nocardia sp. NPDC057440]|uniref:alpha/beta hydrolase n=1 Tax=Nocardia sp. NPDC057440 TaxID=3346134 RepID=UPI00366CF792